MKLLLHLVHKDLRAVGGWAFAILLMALALVLMRQHGQVGGPEWNDFAVKIPWYGQLGGWEWHDIGVQLSWLSWLLVAALQVSLLQVDPPVGSTHFISTRPVSGGTVILSKAIVIFSAGILPVTLASALRLGFSGVPMELSQIGWIALQNAGLLTASLALLALPDALPERKTWIIGAAIMLSGLLASVGFLVLCAAVAGPLQPFLLGLCGLAGAVSMGVAGNYFRLSSRPRLALCLTIGLAVTALASLIHSPSLPPAERQHPVVASSSLQIIPLSPDLSASLAPRRSPRLEIRREVRLTGLPEGIFAEEWKVTGQLQIQGRPETYVLDRLTQSFLNRVVSPIAALNALPPSAGAKAEMVTFAQNKSLLLGRIEVPQAKSGDKLRLTLRGTHYFELFRTELASTIPFQNGSVWSEQGFRLQMSKVRISPHDINLRLETDTVSLDPEAFRSDISEGLGAFSFFAISLPSHAISSLQASFGRNVTFPLQRQQRGHQSASLSLNTNWWLYTGDRSSQLYRRTHSKSLNPADIRLGIFRRIKVGVAQVPFEFVNVDVVIQ